MVRDEAVVSVRQYTRTGSALADEAKSGLSKECRPVKRDWHTSEGDQNGMDRPSGR